MADEKFGPHQSLLFLRLRASLYSVLALFHGCVTIFYDFVKYRLDS